MSTNKLIKVETQYSYSQEKEIKGEVGNQYLSVEDGYKAAKYCALNVIEQIKKDFNSVENIKIVKMNAYVNVAEGFTNIPQVVNGASDCFVEMLKDNGKHARSAVGIFGGVQSFAVKIDVVITKV